MNWRSVPGWEGFYEVSDEGRVRSVTRTLSVRNRFGDMADRTYKGRTLTAAVGSHGYEVVSLSAPGRKGAKACVHVLVAAAFLGPRPPGHEVCHCNGVHTHNALLNLRYDTVRNNALDRRRHDGFATCVRGEASPKAKLTAEDVRWARTAGLTHREMATILGVDHRTIGRAVARLAWKHVN